MEGRPLDEAQLVERAKHGDTGAYRQLVELHQELLFRAAYLALGDAAEAEDATQEGLVKAYGALGRFHSGQPLRPWLLRIVTNEARNRRRSAGRQANLALRAAQHAGRGDAAPSPAAAVLASEERQALLAAVNQLRGEDRTVLAYRYFLDLSEVEMAQALGVRRGTVKSRLSRALARLRQQLGAEPAGKEELRG